MKLAWIFVIVLAVLALGLNLFLRIRKPAPWSEGLGSPLVMGGLILTAWARLLPSAKTGTQRILIGLSLVCTLTGVVLVTLDYLHLFRS